MGTSRSRRDVTVRAPAKINLYLGVGAPRPDGFHPLDTVFHAVSLYDDLHVTDATGWQLGVRAADHIDEVSVPTGGHNIVDRAAGLLADHHAREATGDVVIEKAIPVAGGLAGGSADAAAALVALDRSWRAGTTDDDLLTIAAELGSDVPFALLGGTAHGTGRGEIVTPLTDNGSWWWVIVPSSTGLSTPEVYRRFDALFPQAPAAPPGPELLLRALEAEDPMALAAALHNDLEPATLDLRPELEQLITRGEREGALRGLVSGSGPTCVFLCESGPQAREVAAALREGTDGAAVEPVVLVAHGPVAGAHVVEL